jgi:competence protein ComEC
MRRAYWCEVLLFIVACSPQREFRVHMIDVGYGTAFLLQDGKGAAVLLDGGYREESAVLESTLRASGVDSLALLIASHGHEDHLQGLTWLLEQGWPVGRVAGNAPPGSKRFDTSFWSVLEQRNLHYTQLRRGDTFTAGRFVIRVLHPDTLTRDRNQSSLTLAIRMGARKIMCPADIDSATQRELARLFGNELASDILALPHHGDVLDSDFLQHVSPRWALLSVGPNPWGMPVHHTLTELETRGIRLLDTRTNGTVVLSCSEDAVKIVTTSGPNRLKQREMEMDERIRRWIRDR